MKVALVAFDFGEYCVRLASGIAQDHDINVLLFLANDEAKPYLHLLSNSVELQVFDKPRMRQLFLGQTGHASGPASSRGTAVRSNTSTVRPTTWPGVGYTNAA
jgi:hypothetical protein